MATKRPAPHVHSSRRDQVPGEPSHKRRKANNPYEKSYKKAHPVNHLKSQIRSIKRLLERDDKLPATVRVEKERELQTAQRELEASQRAKEKSDMIGRYHKVRFFDKKNAMKRLKRARKELELCEEGENETQAALEEKVRTAEVDVNYAQYFPLDEHYVSLFPRKPVGVEDKTEEKTNEGVERLGKGDEEVRRRIEECMLAGTLEDLRNGRLKPQSGGLQGDSEVVSSRKREKVLNGKGHRGGAVGLNEAHDAADEDDGTGGGFFE